VYQYFSNEIRFENKKNLSFIIIIFFYAQKLISNLQPKSSQKFVSKVLKQCEKRLDTSLHDRE